MKGLRGGLLLLLLCTVAGASALAAGPRSFTELDGDHDGYLSQSELQQAGPGGMMGNGMMGNGMGGRQGMPAMAMMDGNGDGKISQAEFDAHMAQRHGERFAALDSNRDGVLDSKELANRPHHELNGSTEAWIKQYDKDGDGKLSVSEFEAVRPAQ